MSKQQATTKRDIDLFVMIQPDSDIRVFQFDRPICSRSELFLTLASGDESESIDDLDSNVFFSTEEKPRLQALLESLRNTPSVNIEVEQRSYGIIIREAGIVMHKQESYSDEELIEDVIGVFAEFFQVSTDNIHYTTHTMVL